MGKRVGALALALSLLASCAAPAVKGTPAPAETASPESAAHGWVVRVLESQADGGDYSPLSEADREFYLEAVYDLPEGSWREAEIYTVGGTDAREIGVVTLTSGAEEEKVEKALEEYRVGRVADFTGYAPEQADLAERGAVLVREGEAFLLLCTDVDAALTALGEAPGPEKEPVETPEAPAEETPAPTEIPSASPSPTAAPEPTKAPEPTHTPEPTTAPEQTVTPKPTEAPEATPTPELTHTPEPTTTPTPAALTPEATPTPAATPTASPAPAKGPTPAGYVPFDPPNLFDMTPYDNSAILRAWAAGSTEGLGEVDRAIYDKCAELFAGLITEDMSPFQRELVLHDWMVEHCDYDDSVFDPKTPLGGEHNMDPYGMLVLGRGICMGYATTFQLLMDLAGVECITVAGASSRSHQDHAWNMVKLGGEWYCVDVGWDDSTISSGHTAEEIVQWHHRYFNVTSDLMRRKDHQWDYENVPEATATAYRWDGSGPLPQ